MLYYANFLEFFMIRDLVVYPDQRITVISSVVRFFNEELCKLLEDMKDTMNEHKVDGLIAIQIAVPARVILDMVAVVVYILIYETKKDK
jgi:peptide deformylase